MNSKYKTLFKNVGLLTISNLSSKLLVFLLVPLYTSVLTTEEYGTYDLVVTSVQLVFPILTLNIVDAVMRFSMRQDLAVEKIASIGMGFILKSIPVVIALLLIIYKFNIFPQITPFVWFAFFYYLFYVLNQYFIQLAKGCEKVKDMAIAGIISTVTMVAFNVIFLLVIKLGLFGFFLANTLSLALAVVYFAIRLKIFKLVKFNVKDKALKKEMLKYCVPLITVALSWWVNSSASKYIVSAICGVAANGLLSVAYKIPNIISMIQGLFMQAWQISAIKENKSEDAKKFYSDTFTFMNMALVIACSAFVLFNKFIAKLLFANEFYGAWEFVPFLMVASVFNAATGYLGPILAAENKTKPMAKSAIYSAVVNIALAAVLVYFMGIQGATIATMIASPVSYFIRHKALGFILNNKAHKCNIISWGLLVLQAVVAIYTDWYIIQAVIIAVMIIVYSKQIKLLVEAGLSVVKNIKK